MLLFIFVESYTATWRNRNSCYYRFFFILRFCIVVCVKKKKVLFHTPSFNWLRGVSFSSSFSRCAWDQYSSWRAVVTSTMKPNREELTHLTTLLCAWCSFRRLCMHFSQYSTYSRISKNHSLTTNFLKRPRVPMSLSSSKVVDLTGN